MVHSMSKWVTWEQIAEHTTEENWVTWEQIAEHTTEEKKVCELPGSVATPFPARDGRMR